MSTITGNSRLYPKKRVLFYLFVCLFVCLFVFFFCFLTDWDENQPDGDTDSCLLLSSTGLWLDDSCSIKQDLVVACVQEKQNTSSECCGFTVNLEICKKSGKSYYCE